MTIDKGKRPRDPVQLAKQVFDIAIGEAEDTVSNPASAVLTRKELHSLLLHLTRAEASEASFDEIIMANGDRTPRMSLV